LILFVADSAIEKAGQGLFTDEFIEKDSVICEYTGTQLSLLQTMRLQDKTYLMGGFGLNCHIDAKDHLDVKARYINDARDEKLQNAEFVKMKIQRKALVVSLRDIAAGEEIYCSYGSVYWRSRDGEL
jgi:SET domain-containing protein